MSWQSTPLRGFRISGKTRGQFAERDRRREQRIELRMRAELERRFQPLAMRQRGPVRRRDLADLARDELQAAAVERAAERHRHGPRSVPAQLQHGRLVGGESSAVASPAAEALVCNTRSQSVGRRVGRGELQPRAPAPAPRAPDRCRSASPRRLRSARRETRPAHRARPRRRPRCVRTGPARASQMALSAVSMLAASTARGGGTSAGSGTTASAGRSNTVWCGYSAKTLRPISAVGPGLDPADHRVAIFHRERKAAAHEWRAHALVFALRHPAGEDQRLGAAADRAVEGAHAHLAGRERRKPLLPDFGLARPDVPERLRHLLAARHARSFQLD